MLYEIAIPSDHAPGTHWYHSHLHGATTVQVGGGMVGALIVEDDSSIPPEISSMDEVIMILSHPLIENIGWPNSRFSFELASQDSESISSDPDVRMPGGENHVFLNGQWKPNVAMQAGVYQRWRLIAATHGYSVGIAISDPEACTMNLVAHDGVGIGQKPPRLVETVYLASGSRADVLVSCSTPGSFSLLSVAMTEIECDAEHWTGLIAVMTVGVGPGVSNATDLPSMALLSPLPSYLVDASNHPDKTDFEIEFQRLPPWTIFGAIIMGYGILLILCLNFCAHRTGFLASHLPPHMLWRRNPHSPMEAYLGMKLIYTRYDHLSLTMGKMWPRTHQCHQLRMVLKSQNPL